MFELESFLHQLFRGFEEAGVSWAILRGWDDLPYSTGGSDLDVLVSRSELSQAMRAVLAIPGPRLIYTRRQNHVLSICLEGINMPSHSGLTLDLVSSLSFKGLPYLDEVDVLASARVLPRGTGLRVASDLHSSLVSLMNLYLISGKVQFDTKFVSYIGGMKPQTVQALSNKLSAPVAKQLIEAVVADDPDMLRRLLPRVRRNFLLRRLKVAPFDTLLRMTRHYWRELTTRLAVGNRFVLTVLGPDGAGKSSLIDALALRCKPIFPTIRRIHLKQALFFRGRVAERGVVIEPHGLPPRGHVASTTKLVLWVIENWVAWIRPASTKSLIIYDRDINDAIIDPVRFRLRLSPRWVRLAAFLSPKPDLVIILDVPPKLAHQRKGELPLATLEELCAEYRGFAAHGANRILIDASLSVEQVCDKAYGALIEGVRVASRRVPEREK
jgi:thymidylate kinase